MLKRVALSWSESLGWCVELPTYRMISGSFLPVAAGLVGADGVLGKADPADVLALGASVLVELPGDTVFDSAGQVDLDALRVLYPDWVRDRLPGVVLAAVLASS